MADAGEDVAKEISDLARAAIAQIVAAPGPMSLKMEAILLVSALSMAATAVGTLLAGGIAQRAGAPGAGGPRLGPWDEFAKDVLQKKVGGPIEHADNRQFLPFRGI